MVHYHEKIDFTSEVFVVFENKVLLRRHDKYKLWLSVGGHVDLDEDPVEAAIREVKEEVGLDVVIHVQDGFEDFAEETFRDLIPPIFMNRHKISETHEHISLVYFARSNTFELELSETEKTDACKWFTLAELSDPQFGVTKNVARYAKEALRQLKN